MDSAPLGKVFNEDNETNSKEKKKSESKNFHQVVREY